MSELMEDKKMFELFRNDRSEGVEAYKKWKQQQRLKLTTVGPYHVSTVRLICDQGFLGTPLWYETMVYREDENNNPIFEEYQERYETAEEALVGHEVATTEYMRRTQEEDDEADVELHESKVDEQGDK